MPSCELKAFDMKKKKKKTCLLQSENENNNNRKDRKECICTAQAQNPSVIAHGHRE